jgi:GT2 family glycosyltransferase
MTLLLECLDAVLGQTQPVERVHVIDNASTDGTSELLAKRRDIVHSRLKDNVGGAGGFSHGVDVARREEVDWLWLMDDDAEPQPDCLERMLASPAASDPATVALCSRVEGPDGALQALHRGFLGARPRALPAANYRNSPRLGYATFVGLLVRADAARALELPRAEYFIWADDYEYSLRLRQRGEIRLVPESLIVHKDARQPFLTRRARLVNRLLGWELVSTRYEDAWRNFFGLRNYVSMMQRLEGQSALGAAATTAQFIIKAVLYDEKPLPRIPWLIRFAFDGRRGVFDNRLAETWPRRPA